MDYLKMKKEELIALLKENESLVEAAKTLVHLPKAIEAKDKEISKVKAQLEKAIEAKDKAYQNDIKNKDEALENLRKELAEKYDREYHSFKTKTDEELNKTKDALAESQKKNYELDKARIEQLEEVLFAYGDLLKIMQGTVDTHMKLNTLVVSKLSGGK